RDGLRCVSLEHSARETRVAGERGGQRLDHRAGARPGQRLCPGGEEASRQICGGERRAESRRPLTLHAFSRCPCGSRPAGPPMNVTQAARCLTLATMFIAIALATTDSDAGQTSVKAVSLEDVVKRSDRILVVKVADPPSEKRVIRIRGKS